MTQTALAASAGISREYVRLLEAGRSDPTVGMLQRLADALGVSLWTVLRPPSPRPKKRKGA
jgi:transcriptional regulator with XRE-family HTH domain